MTNTGRNEAQNKTTYTEDRRAADRRKLVLLVGMLESGDVSIFCIIKNISAGGVQVMPYGPVFKGTELSLRVSDENPIPGTVAWSRDGMVGVEFGQPLDTETLRRIGTKMVTHRRRIVPRVTTTLDGCLWTDGERHSVTIYDLSVAGARLRTAQPVTVGNTAIMEVAGLPSLSVDLRWSDGAEYGVTFQRPLPMQLIADLLSGHSPQV